MAIIYYRDFLARVKYTFKYVRICIQYLKCIHHIKNGNLAILITIVCSISVIYILAINLITNIYVREVVKIFYRHAMDFNHYVKSYILFVGFCIEYLYVNAFEFSVTYFFRI